MIPGTTPERSAKALKRVRRDPEPEPAIIEEEWDAHPVVESGGVEYFGIKALAKAWDDRTVHSIYRLEKKGILPKARYRTARGQRKDRLYSREQIEAIIRIAQECGVYKTSTRTNITRSGFTRRLLEVW